MTVKELYRNKWVRFSFWTVLYSLWVIWTNNYWLFFGIPVVYEFTVSQILKRYIPKTSLFSWIDTILFATVVVTFVNIFFFQAFKIPSSSMESSLMTGDYLFVSKVAYGPKTPQTPLTMPFVHNVLPFSGKESYSTAIQCDYKRLKGFGKVKRDDYVVFSFPHGDTVLTKAPMDDYYTHVRMTSREYAIRTYGPIVVRPADKKDHYVKRCVAVAGDTLQIKDGWVYVDGVAQERYSGIQLTYTVVTEGSPINSLILKDLGLNVSELYYNPQLPGYPSMPLTDSRLEKVKALANVKSVTSNVDTDGSEFLDSDLFLFPFTQTGWTNDNYGPIWVPKAGATVELTEENLPIYRRIIEVYEGNTLEVDGEVFVINGQRTSTYTFKMDYYFMMGDNRHNSLDSRYWGFVPEDHIVGKPSVIWFSSDSNYRFPKNIRWRRLLKFV